MVSEEGSFTIITNHCTMYLQLWQLVIITQLMCTLIQRILRVNNRISDTRLNRTPAQQIQETWRRGPSMITYLSPYEACTPAMTIEVPLVLVWQARIHAVRTHRCSDVLTIRRTSGMSMPQVNFLCCYVECSYCPKRDAFDL